MTNIVNVTKRFVIKQDGASELVVYGLLVLFSLVVSGAAYVALNPVLDTGIASVTTHITNTFTTVAGL